MGVGKADVEDTSIDIDTVNQVIHSLWLSIRSIVFIGIIHEKWPTSLCRKGIDQRTRDANAF